MTFGVTIGGVSFTDCVLLNPAPVYAQENENDSGEPVLSSSRFGLSRIPMSSAQLAVMDSLVASMQPVEVVVTFGATSRTLLTRQNRVTYDAANELYEIEAVSIESEDIGELKNAGQDVLVLVFPAGDWSGKVIYNESTSESRSFLEVNDILTHIADYFNMDYTPDSAFDNYWIGGKKFATAFDADWFEGKTAYSILSDIAEFFNCVWKIERSGITKTLMFLPKKSLVDAKAALDPLVLPALLGEKKPANDAALDALRMDYPQPEWINFGGELTPGYDIAVPVKRTIDSAFKGAIYFGGGGATGKAHIVSSEDNIDYIMYSTNDFPDDSLWIELQDIVDEFFAFEQAWTNRVKVPFSLIEASNDEIETLAGLLYDKVSVPGFSGTYHGVNCSLDLATEIATIDVIGT